MARVEIEERAFSDPRLKKLCRKLRWSPREAIGALVILWHDSQDQDLVEASADDIDTWLDLEGDEAERVREALLATGYLEKSRKDFLVIDGNATRCAKVRAYKSRAKKAAKARWEGPYESSNATSMPKHRQAAKETSKTPKKKASKRVRKSSSSVSKNTPKTVKSVDITVSSEECYKHAQASTLSMGQAMPTTIQQDKEIYKTSDEVLCSSPVRAFIAAYCEAYKKRYDSNPVIVGKTSGIAKRILKDVPLKRAVALVQTYCAMSDSWFVTRSHNLSTFEDNLDKIARKMETGKSTSASQARKAEQFDDNKSVALNFLQRSQAGG